MVKKMRKIKIQGTTLLYLCLKLNILISVKCAYNTLKGHYVVLEIQFRIFIFTLLLMNVIFFSITE